MVEEMHQTHYQRMQDFLADSSKVSSSATNSDLPSQLTREITFAATTRPHISTTPTFVGCMICVASLPERAE